MAAPYGFNTLAYRPDMTAPLPSGDPIPGRPGDAAALQGAVQSVAGFGDPNEPRGVRNNNPGNIEYGPFARAHGATGSDGRFAIFPTPEAGISAIVALQNVYENKHGLQSVSERIGRWAPTSENNTSAYAQAVAKAMGISPTQPFSMSDPRMAQAFITAMIQHENGKQPYSQEQIAAGYAQTGGRAVPAPAAAPAPVQADYGGGRLYAPARDTALAFAPTMAQAPAAQAASAMAFGAMDAAPQLPAKGSDMARSSGSLPFSARDFGFTRSPGGMDSQGRVTGYANDAIVTPTQSFRPDQLSRNSIGSAAIMPSTFRSYLPQSPAPAQQVAPARAAPSGAMAPGNLAAMAALYGQSPKQLGAPILDSRAFRPTPMSAPVKNVKPVYNPPRPAQAAQRAPAAPARTGGNALTRGLQTVTQAARSLTSGDAAQAAVGLLSGYGGGSAPAGANPSMFAGTGYSWSNPGAYAGGNPYEYAFAATPFR